MRPRGVVGRTVRPQSILGSEMSSMYFAAPVTLAEPSLRGTFRPTDRKRFGMATSVGPDASRSSGPDRRLFRGRGGAFQVRVQELQDRGPRGDLVLPFAEAVPLIVEDDVLDRNTVLLDRGDDVVRLRLDDARVVGALADAQRFAD